MNADKGMPGGVIAVFIVIFILSSVTTPSSSCYLGNWTPPDPPVSRPVEDGKR